MYPDPEFFDTGTQKLRRAWARLRTSISRLVLKNPWEPHRPALSSRPLPSMVRPGAERRIVVRSRSGPVGEVVRWRQGMVSIRCLDGRLLEVDEAKLRAQPDGACFLTEDAADAGTPSVPGNAEIVVPVVQERLEVDKERVVTGRVRLTKTVQTRTETVNPLLTEEDVVVERVPIGQRVEQAPPIRYEGQTMIIPVLTEVIEVHTHLVLAEELHVVRTQRQVYRPQEVELRTEEVTIERSQEQPVDRVAERVRTAG